MDRKIPLSVFFLGLLWCMVSAMAPVGVLLWRWVSLWSDPPDWNVVGPVAITCAGMGAWGFWRKYSAQVSLPPTWAQAIDLAGKVKTTTETVEQLKNPPRTVTTTVEETKAKPPEDLK